MDRLTSSIVNARDLDELLPLMVTLSRKTQDLMTARQLREGEVRQLARPLELMRLLLTALASFERSSGAGAAGGSLAGDLAERYLELEGRVKELRNDLARQRSRFAP